MSKLYEETSHQKAVRLKKRSAYRRRLKYRRRVELCIYYGVSLVVLLVVTSGVLYIHHGLKQMGEVNAGEEVILAQESVGEICEEIEETSGENEETSGAVGEISEALEISSEDWKLILVNESNPVPTDYTCEMVVLSNGKMVDERCYEALQEMMDDCRAQGYDPLICSAYRSYERQEELFEEMMVQYESEGYTSEEAYELAKTSVSIPGTSEHQLGLALDIVSVGNQRLDENQSENPTQKWLMNHSWEYGFILRYPEGKSEITGTIYEPWHYRYVGEEAARAIYEQGICLEEYLSSM